MSVESADRAIAVSHLGAVAGCVALATSAACYSYRPLGETTPSPGREVRATLASPVSLRVGELTLHDVNRVEGLIYAASPNSLSVSGSWVYTQVGSRYPANGGVFPLERPALRSLEVRRLSVHRTGLAAVLTVGVVAALFGVVDQVFSGSGAPPPPGQGN
jgi:hypothetical protein